MTGNFDKWALGLAAAVTAICAAGLAAVAIRTGSWGYALFALGGTIAAREMTAELWQQRKRNNKT